jgi:hypothetical protein
MASAGDLLAAHRRRDIASPGMNARRFDILLATASRFALLGKSWLLRSALSRITRSAPRRRSLVRTPSHLAAYALRSPAQKLL